MWRCRPSCWARISIESYWVYDICYNNASDIVPTAGTGDIHGISKANFAILCWFGTNLAPRFTDMQS
jgi:hypothetical protein